MKYLLQRRIVFRGKRGAWRTISKHDSEADAKRAAKRDRTANAQHRVTFDRRICR